MRKALATTALVVLGALIAAPAGAQPYPPDEPTAGISDTTLFRGQTTTVCGQDWLPGSEVTISLEGRVLATATVSAEGTFCAAITIPESASLGPATITVSGLGASGEPATETISVTIFALADGVVAGTGAGLSVGLMAIAGLVFLGLAALAVGRRRAARGEKTSTSV